MTEPYHLPYDYARCAGVLSTYPTLAWRVDCETCLRRLAPPHPTRGANFITPQPEPCEYRIIPWQL